MSKSDYTTALANVTTAIGDSSSGYIGNPLMNEPIILFSSFQSIEATELSNAGGESAPSSFYTRKITEFEKLLDYITNITTENGLFL